MLKPIFRSKFKRRDRPMERFMVFPFCHCVAPEAIWHARKGYRRTE